MKPKRLHIIPLQADLGPVRGRKGDSGAGFVADIDAQAARGLDHRSVQLDRLIMRNRLFQGYIDDLPVAPGDHAVELAGGDQIDRVHTECGRQKPVPPARARAFPGVPG